VITQNGVLLSPDPGALDARVGVTLGVVNIGDRFRHMWKPTKQASVERGVADSNTAAAERQAEIVDELDTRTSRVLAEMEATQLLLAELRSTDARH
jgi:hypothetical protein